MHYWLAVHFFKRHDLLGCMRMARSDQLHNGCNGMFLPNGERIGRGGLHKQTYERVGCR